MASSHNISLIWLLKNVKEPLQGTWQSLLLIITTVLNFSRHSSSSSLSRSASKEVKKKIIIIILVVTKGYRVWATTIEGQNIFAPTLCFAQVSCDRWSKHAFHDQITSDRKSECEWSNRILCIPFIPFILSGSPNECWLHTCNACMISTRRLGLRAPLVAHN